MTRAALVLAALVLHAAPGGAQTFSSRIDAVRVDVLVTDRDRIVRDLRAADFEVFDDGVLQEVDLVTFERLPLNVVLVFDMSDSLAGERLEHLRAAGLALVDDLAPDDEAALVTFSHGVSISAPLTKDRLPLRKALERAEGQGRTALVDATHTGMVLAESGVGRSLLITFSDGVDTASWLSADTVLDTARRSDVVVYCVSTAARRNAEFAAEMASLTGGGFIEIASTKDLRASLLRILEEFRQRYLVSYTPRNVSREGWHRLEVRVKGRRGTVKARPGYLAGT